MLMSICNLLVRLEALQTFEVGWQFLFHFLADGNPIIIMPSIDNSNISTRTSCLMKLKRLLPITANRAKIDDGTLTDMSVLIDQWRFVQLNYELILLERERNQRPNVFLSMFAYCAVQRHDHDPYEKMFAALSNEHLGKLVLAFNMLEELVRSYPNDRCFPSIILQFTEHHKMAEEHDKHMQLFKLLGMDVKG